MAPCVVIERLEGKQQCSRAPVGEHAEVQAQDAECGCHEQQEVNEKRPKPRNSPPHNHDSTAPRQHPQSTFVNTYAGLRDLMIWANCFFSFNMSFLWRKVEDVTTISNPQSLTSVSIQDCTLRAPNKTITLFLHE